MKRIERPRVEDIYNGEQFKIVDTQSFEVEHQLNEPSSIDFRIFNTERNKLAFPLVKEYNFIFYDKEYYLILLHDEDSSDVKSGAAIHISSILKKKRVHEEYTGYFSIDDVLNITFEGSDFSVVNLAKKTKKLQFENFGKSDRLSMLQHVLKRFKVECYFSKYTVYIFDKVGAETDYQFRFGYNIKAINKKVDVTNCTFSVLVRGHTPTEEEGGGEQFVYYYESPIKYKMPEIIRDWEASVIEDDRVKNLETAIEQAREEVQDTPEITITVSHEVLPNEKERIPGIGDRALVRHYKMKLDFDVRIVKIRQYPYDNRSDEYEFSNKKEDVIDRNENKDDEKSDLDLLLKQIQEINKKIVNFVTAATMDGKFDESEKAQYEKLIQTKRELETKAETLASDAISTANTYTDEAKRNAIEIAKAEAQSKAKEAEKAASEYARLQAEYAQKEAQSHADGVVTASEKAILDQAEQKVAAAKTYAEQKAKEAQSAAEKSAALDATDKSNSAKNAAIEAAKLNAAEKAEEARLAAIKAANAETALTEERTKAYADGKITVEENMRIEALEKAAKEAQQDAQNKATSAKQAAISASALDASNKADKAKADAIAAAQADAQTKANAAKQAASEYAKAQAELAEKQAKAHADGVVTVSEKAVLDQAEQKVAAAKTYAAQKAKEAETAAKAAAATDAQNKADKAKADAIAAAQADAKTKADAAKQAALDYAKAQAELAEKQAKAHADGVVTASEKAVLNQAEQKVAAAKTYAEQKAKEAETAANNATNLKIDGLTFGANNLITGTQNKNANGWKPWGSIGRVGVYGPMGTAKQCLYIETKSADGKTNLVVPQGTPIGLQGDGHAFSVKSGQEYTLSMEVATSELGNKLSYIHLMYSVAGGNKQLQEINVTNFTKTEPIYVGATTYYYKVNLTFKADRDDNNVHLLIGGVTTRALDGSNSYAWIRLYELQVVPGNKAYVYSISPLDVQSDIDNAKVLAEQKAKEAQNAAQTYAEQKAAYEREQAKVYADGQITASEAKTLADAKEKMDAAKRHAETKATEAKTAAIAAAQADAQTKANAAKQAASDYAKAQAELAEKQAKSHADGVVTASEKAVLDQAEQKVAAAKTYAEQKAKEAETAAKTAAATDAKNKADKAKADAIAAAQADAQTKANAAKQAASDYAKAQAELAEKQAKAHADGVVTASEKVVLDQAEQKVVAAKTYAEQKAKEAEAAAKNAAAVDASNKANAAESKAKDYTDNIAVSKKKIIFEINNSTETILLEAKRINLKGAVTAESIASKYLEGIEIMVKSPTDQNSYVRLDKGGFMETVLKNKGSDGKTNFRGEFGAGAQVFEIFSDGKRVRYLETNGNGLQMYDGNNYATFGGNNIGITDNGQNKTVSISAYSSEFDWMPVLRVESPSQRGKSALTPRYLLFDVDGNRVKLEVDSWGMGVHYNSYRAFHVEKGKYGGTEMWINEGKGKFRSDGGYGGKMQVLDEFGNTQGIVAKEFTTSSQRKLKQFIKPLEFDSLEEIKKLRVCQYIFKSQYEELLKKRAERVDGEELPTIKDIKPSHGFIVDDSPKYFLDDSEQAVAQYGTLSILIDAFQQYMKQTNTKIQLIEKEISNVGRENSSRARYLRKSIRRTTKQGHPRKKRAFGARN
ncbi:phage tail protein [Bacillus wiedmannii]|uniref:phage tail protein n=1 Tax=Bacillus wiedmannii TaxID=1890302 RepID=UPI000B728C4C|nr:hypothetical protein BK740_07230 [Bacillus thuringiensis serovar argentinensis]